MNLHAYIDGFNLYRGIIDHKNNMPGVRKSKGLRCYLWLDLAGYVESFYDSNYSLRHVHYFTAPVRDNPAALIRQETYWKAIESNPNLTIHRGVNARRYDKNWNVVSYEEKQSDVRFGLQVLEDALTNPNLKAIALVTADSDQVPTIERVQVVRPDIEVKLIFPPLRHSGALEKLLVPEKTNYVPLRDNQLSDPVEYERAGTKIIVSKPVEWS